MRYSFLIETYETERIKVVSAWSGFRDEDLSFRPNPEDPRLNPYGGAIACGHPLAATGVRLIAQLAYGFRERPDVRYGLTGLCVGMGMGAVIVWENLAAGH